MKKFQQLVFLFVLLHCPVQIYAGHLFSVSEVLDSLYGIIYYEKYNHETGGDAIRMDDYGEPCENTVIDYYDDGTVLHRGTYIRGKLFTYKNYFPDGKLERKFKGLAGARHSMETFYQNGTPRSKIVYFRKDALLWNEYYPNGQLEFSEKYTAKFQLLYRRTYSEDGKPESIFELVNKKKNAYLHKEFYETGTVKEEGRMVFSDDIVDFHREGSWKIYNENGQLIRTEEYVHGVFNAENVSGNSTDKPPTNQSKAGTNTQTTAQKEDSKKVTAEQVDSFFEEEEEEEEETVTGKAKNTKKKNKR